MEETRAQYEELLKASRAQNFTCTLKVTSSTDGFRVMDPFDWTADKNIYQRWQLWSHKARLALDTMEGDNEKTKISYLHHWLDGKGISKIKGWRNSKTLITQAEYDALEERDRKGKYSLDKVESYFSLVESILTPRSNPLLAVEELHLAKQGSMTSEEFYSQILEIVKRCRFPNQEAEDRAVRDAIFICKQLFLLFNLLFAFCVFVLSSEVCAGLGNGCERFCTSRSLLGSYIHQESI